MNIVYSEPRRLDREEIDDITSVIPNPREIGNVGTTIKREIKNNLRIQFEDEEFGISLDDESKNEIEDFIRQAYGNSIVKTGSMVGAWCAEAIGEKSLQMALNSFHKAGTGASADVSSGVAAMKEMLTLTKSPKKPVSYIFYKNQENLNYGEIIKNKYQYIDVVLEILISDSEIDTPSEFELRTGDTYQYVEKLDVYSKPYVETTVLPMNNLTWWHKLYIQLNNITNEIYYATYMMRLTINVNSMYNYKVTIEEIVNVIAKSDPEGTLIIIPSPTFLDEENGIPFSYIDIFVNRSMNSKIISELKMDNAIFEINIERSYLAITISDKIPKLQIKGISKIKNLFPVTNMVWLVVKRIREITNCNFIQIPSDVKLWEILLDFDRSRQTGISFKEIANLMKVLGAQPVYENGLLVVEIGKSPGILDLDSKIFYDASASSSSYYFHLAPDYKMYCFSAENPKDIYLAVSKLDQSNLEKYERENPGMVRPDTEFSRANTHVSSIAEGINFRKILIMDDVDETMSYVSDPNVIYETLGIEAARTFIILRLVEIMAKGGELPINHRHLELLADYMCNKGGMDPITIKGITNQKEGTVQNASFQEAMRMYTEASFGSTETTNSLSTAISVGHKPTVGSIIEDETYDVVEYEKVKNEILNNKGKLSIDYFSKALKELPDAGEFNNPMSFVNDNEIDPEHGTLKDEMATETQEDYSFYDDNYNPDVVTVEPTTQSVSNISPPVTNTRTVGAPEVQRAASRFTAIPVNTYPDPTTTVSSVPSEPIRSLDVPYKPGTPSRYLISGSPVNLDRLEYFTTTTTTTTSPIIPSSPLQLESCPPYQPSQSDLIPPQVCKVSRQPQQTRPLMRRNPTQSSFLQ